LECWRAASRTHFNKSAHHHQRIQPDAAQQPFESDENRSSVEQIMKAGERAAELTRQLLTFSRRQVVRPKVQDLNVVVAGAAVMLRRLIGEHIELRIITAPELAKIHADRSQVEQVIINLAVNSRDAMPTGGTLTIETQSVEFSEPVSRSSHHFETGPVRHAGGE